MSASTATARNRAGKKSICGETAKSDCVLAKLQPPGDGGRTQADTQKGERGLRDDDATDECRSDSEYRAQRIGEYVPEDDLTVKNPDD